MSVRTPAEIPADHQQLFLDAVHSGIGEYYSLVPMRFRSKSFGVRFGAAVSGTAAVTNGSKTVTAMSVTPVDGASVVLAGDLVVNRVWANPTGSGYLLEIPFGGATGTVGATVSRDVAIIPWDIAGFLTQPRNALTDEELQEVPAGAGPEWRRVLVAGFRVDQAGQNTVLRIIPAPSSDLPVTMDVEIQNVSISGIESVTSFTATPLPFNDDHAIRLVLPLCGARLVGHPLWRDPGQAKVANEAAASARVDISLLRQRTGAGPYRIRAPHP